MNPAIQAGHDLINLIFLSPHLYCSPLYPTALCTPICGEHWGWGQHDQTDHPRGTLPFVSHHEGHQTTTSPRACACFLDNLCPTLYSGLLSWGSSWRGRQGAGRVHADRPQAHYPAWVQSGKRRQPCAFSCQDVTAHPRALESFGVTWCAEAPALPTPAEGSSSPGR